MSSSFSSGPQGGISFGAPRYKIYKALTNFASSGGVNPLDAHTPLPFNRIIGIQELVVVNETTGFTWIIELEGGTNGLSNGYIGAYDQSNNYNITEAVLNCSFQALTPPTNTTRVNQFQITTAAPDSKIYTLAYSPFPNVLPTITLNTPYALGAQSLKLITKYARFFLG